MPTAAAIPLLFAQAKARDLWQNATVHARMAAHEITQGEFRGFFLLALGLSAIGLATPWIGALGAVSALFGLLAWEHAHVQAGQSVPLA